MDYEYANALFNTPRQASRAAVSDYLYACGKNSVEDVADMAKTPVTEIVAEMKAVGWEIPYLDEHNQPVEEMVNEIICKAQEEALANKDED